MSNIISSAIFCARNVDKAENQDKVGRWAVAVGQAKKVTDYVTTLDNCVGRDSKAAADAIKSYAKEEKIFKYAGKAANFASKNINPLICVSSGIDILKADDKETALISNAAALGTMFAVEKQMKKHLSNIPKTKSETIQNISKNVMKFAEKYKCTKTLPAILHGTAFVVGSCAAYGGGEKFGTLVAGKITGREKQEVKKSPEKLEIPEVPELKEKQEKEI